MNMNIRLGQLAPAARFCKLFAECHKTILPANHFETSNAYHQLGTIFDQQIDAKVGRAPKTLVATLLKQKKEAFQVCAAMRRVCLGPNHPETLEVEKMAQ
jgi:hypothetical protein